MAGLSEPGAQDPMSIALLVAAVFERLGVRYLLGGSMASTAYGEPRTTLDVDFVADLAPETTAALLSALGVDFEANREWIEDEVRRRGSFQIIHRRTFTRIDVFVPPWTGVHLWKWQHRRRVVIDPSCGSEIDVTSPEGIVIQKLAWYRATGEQSDRHWRDVLGVLKVQRRAVDVAVMRSWAVELEFEPLLDRALKEAGIAAS